MRPEAIFCSLGGSVFTNNQFKTVKHRVQLCRYNGELEFSEQQMRDAVGSAMDRISHLVNTIEEQDLDRSDEADMQLIRSAVQPLPESGQSLDSLLDWLFGDARIKSLNTASPGFMAYVPGGGIFSCGAR